MVKRTYHVPAKPKDDDGHLELIARIIFVIGFKYEIVEQRWPKMKKAFKNFSPKIDPTAYVAPTASVIGRVKIASGAGVWPGAVLRPIRSGTLCPVSEPTFAGGVEGWSAELSYSSWQAVRFWR